jgi:hypothetical protein
MKRKWVVAAAIVVAVGTLSGCLENPDQQTCNEMAGSGWFAPKKFDDGWYCFSEIKGEMFYLRPLEDDE